MSEAIIITELLKNVEGRVNKLKKENEVLREACEQALRLLNTSGLGTTNCVVKLKQALKLEKGK